MKNLRHTFIFLSSLLVVIFLIASCGMKQTVRYDQPILRQEIGYYEKAWVDPVVTYTDSILTIIRANRVDSFYVDKPVPSFQDHITTLAFEVTHPNCFTSVLLLDNDGYVLSVLVADELSQGHYKVSLQSSQISYVQEPAKRFFLKIDFCGFSVIEEIR